MQTKNLALAVLLSAACSAPALAISTGTLHGVVRDPMKHSRVSGARVRVEDDGMVRTMQTNASGSFSFLGLPAGRVSLTITVPHFMPVTMQTCVNDSETRTLDLFAPQSVHYVAHMMPPHPFPMTYAQHDRDEARRAPMNETHDRYSLGNC
jgi:hypothetical protein